MPKTTIVLPTYNEAENLPLMIKAILDLKLPSLTVLVVDDNSPDGTGKIADQLAAQHQGQIKVLHRAGKEGLGRAYVAGFKHAIQDGAEYILEMDCDFSHQPKYLPNLIAKADAGYELVLGSRYMRGGGVDESWSPYRKLLSWFANSVYVRMLLGLPVKDVTSGYRVWKRETLIGLDLDRITSNGYAFQVELTYVTYRLGYKIAEVPIYFPDRQHGESKMDLRIASEAALRVWEMRRRHHHLTPQKRRQQAYTVP